MSQAVVLLPIGALAWLAGGIDPSIFNAATSLAFTLPGSRKQEEEADYIGLLMMAESCYDPSAAVGLWDRMEKAEKGAPPQFLSTHPSSHNRMGKIQGWLPDAQVKRESSGCYGTSGYGGFERTRLYSNLLLTMEQLTTFGERLMSNAGEPLRNTWPTKDEQLMPMALSRR